MKLREADSNAGYLCKYSSMLNLSEPLFPQLFICKISGLILKAPLESHILWFMLLSFVLREAMWL